MTWWKASSVTVTAGQSTVTVNTGNDVGIIKGAEGLVIGNQPPVEIKRSYLNGSVKTLELVAPWPYANQSGQPAVAFPTDGDLAEATKILRSVGNDAVTFAEKLSAILTSTTPTIPIETEAAGTLNVVPYAYLVNMFNTLLSGFGDFGQPLYQTDSKNEARQMLGLVPQILAQPTLRMDFVNNEHYVYEKYGLTKKNITEALSTARASSASYNSPFGVATAALNEPRIEFSPKTGECLGLLCEEQRTNLLIHSVYTAANGKTPPTSWSLQHGSGNTLTSVSSRVPGATRTQQTGTNQREYYQQSVNLAANTTYTLSAFFGADTAASGQVMGIGSPAGGSATGTLFLSGSSVIPNMVNSITFTTDNVGGNYTIRVGLGCFSDATGIVTHETPQLESGLFPTSYIKTETSQVTRALEQHNLAISHNPNEFTIYGEISGAQLSSVNRALSVGTSSTNRIELFNSGLATVIAGDVIRSINYTPNFLPQNSYKIAYRFINGIVTLAVNGIIVGYTAQSTNKTFDTSLVRLSSNANNNQPSTLTYSGVSYIPKALSDTELTFLTK